MRDWGCVFGRFLETFVIVPMDVLVDRLVKLPSDDEGLTFVNHLCEMFGKARFLRVLKSGFSRMPIAPQMKEISL
ncbi:hypothetical protein CFREI_09020 [Corynebacterium freiburgense]|nr:hypothetical protein CFREI_09020 [Corynebacterium freiburgense]